MGYPTFRNKLKNKLSLLKSASYWNLVKELFGANLKVKRHNSFLGYLWFTLGPLIMIIIMYVVFNSKFGKGISNYPVYLVIGVVIVSYFVSLTTTNLKLFAHKRKLISNSLIPREIFVYVSILTKTMRLVFEIAIALLLGVALEIITFKSLLLLFPLLFSYVLFVSGVCFLLSILYGFSSDLEYVWMFLSRMMYFIAPVFYSVSDISSVVHKWIYYLNPITPFLTSFRGLFSSEVIVGAYLQSIFLGLGTFCVGYFVFIKFENKVVEYV